MNEFENKVAVITGGAQGIGKCIAEEFRNNGASAEIIDIRDGDWYTGDLADPRVIEQFAQYVIGKHRHVDYLINNALPRMKGINDCTYEEFMNALAVGAGAPFYLSKLFLPYFREGACIVNISSSRDRMSQPQTESYTTAKGAIAALTHAMGDRLAPGCASIPSLPDGSIRNTGNMKDRMPSSSRPEESGIPWISPMPYCFCVLTKPVSSPVRISVWTEV